MMKQFKESKASQKLSRKSKIPHQAIARTILYATAVPLSQQPTTTKPFATAVPVTRMNSASIATIGVIKLDQSDVRVWDKVLYTANPGNPSEQEQCVIVQIHKDPPEADYYTIRSVHDNGQREHQTVGKRLCIVPKPIMTKATTTTTTIDKKYPDNCSSSGIDTTVKLLEKLKLAEIKNNELTENLKETVNERDTIRLNTLQHVSGYEERVKSIVEEYEQNISTLQTEIDRFKNVLAQKVTVAIENKGLIKNAEKYEQKISTLQNEIDRSKNELAQKMAVAVENNKLIKNVENLQKEIELCNNNRRELECNHVKTQDQLSKLSKEKEAYKGNGLISEKNEDHLLILNEKSNEIVKLKNLFETAQNKIDHLEHSELYLKEQYDKAMDYLNNLRKDHLIGLKNYEKALNKTKKALQVSELKNELWAKSIDTAVASDTSSPTPATSLYVPLIESESQLNSSLSVSSSVTNTMINGSATEEDDGLIMMGEGPSILQIEPAILLDDGRKFHINFDDVCLSTSLYTILQTYPHATPAEIRSSYIRIVRQVHPDKNLDDQDAHNDTVLVNDAYKVLSDPILRKKYDHKMAMKPRMKKKRVPVSSEQYAQKKENALVYATTLFWLQSESDAKANQAHAINEIQEMKAKMLADTTAKKVETDKKSQQVRPRLEIHSTNPRPKKKKRISALDSLKFGNPGNYWH